MGFVLLVKFHNNHLYFQDTWDLYYLCSRIQTQIYAKNKQLLKVQFILYFSIKKVIM